MGDDEHKKGMSPVKAALAGAVVGAGIAATVVVLQDEKKRKKVTEALSNVKDQAGQYMENVKNNPDTKKGVEQIKELTGSESHQSEKKTKSTR